MSLLSTRPLLDLQRRDSGGLIWGYRLASAEAVDLGAADDEAGPTWFHFNLADSRARGWLSEHAGLPEDALEIMLDLTPAFGSTPRHPVSSA